MKRIICLLTALSMVTLLLVTGCSKEKSTVSTTPASEVLSKSYDSMQAVKSFHFELDHSGGGTPIAMGLEMTKAEGDIARPDKMQGTIDGTAMGSSIQVKLITTKEKTMMTNPLNGKWEVLPDQFKVLSVFDPSTGISAIIKGIKNTTSVKEQKVDGVLCYLLEGDIASEALSPITGSSIKNETVKAEIWIEKEGFLVHKVKLTGKITNGEKEGIVRTLVFSDFNKEMNITLPK